MYNLNTKSVVTGIVTCIFIGFIIAGVIFVYHQYSSDCIRDKVMGLFSSKTENFESSKQNINTLDYAETVRELKKENTALKEYNEQLHRKMLEIERKVNNHHSNRTTESGDSAPRPRLSEISKVKLEAHIEKMLKDKSINIKYLPDFVEEALYRNVFGMLLNLLDYTLETANVELLGQQLQFDLKAPNDDELHLNNIKNANNIEEEI